MQDTFVAYQPILIKSAWPKSLLLHPALARLLNSTWVDVDTPAMMGLKVSRTSK